MLTQLPTPTQMDPVDANMVRLPQTDLLGGQRNYGPFKFGSKLYAVLNDANLTQVAIYSSSDNGATWTRLDALNEPANSGTVASQFAGSTIYLAYDPTGGGLVIQTFDMNTDTYGAASVAGPVDVANDFFFVRQTGGDIYVIYSVVTGLTTQEVRYSRFSGAAWDPAVAVSATSVGTRRFNPGIVLDSSDRMHVFYSEALDPIAANNISLIYAPVSAAGVVGATVTLYTSPAIGAFNLATGSGAYWAGEDQVLYPFFDSSIGDLNMLAGTPAAAPVWSTSTIQALPVPFNPFVSLYAFSDDAIGTAYLFYAASDGAPSTTINLMYSQNTGAGWSAVAVLYDLIANPPNAEPGQVISEIAPTILPNPGAAVILNMLGAGGVIFAFFAGAAAVPIVRAQVVFQGVRRQRGKAPGSGKNFKPKPFSYVLAGTLTADASAGPAAPLVLIQTINDYDFDLYQLKITYSSAAALPRVVSAINLFDAVKNSISNMPIHDVYWNGAPGSEYQNGALVVPLHYPQQSQIRLEAFSMVGGLNLPVDMRVECVGVQRFPC